MVLQIQTELDTIRPGCIHTICGGFRRGKVDSNDVDIVITDPNPVSLNSQITCIEDLLRQMKKKALITHVVNVTTPSSTFEAIYSHLDIAEVVILPPTSSFITTPRHRRVDIIFVSKEGGGEGAEQRFADEIIVIQDFLHARFFFFSALIIRMELRY